VQSLLIFYISGISPWTVTAIALPVAFVVGLLSWRAVEKPALDQRTLFFTLRGQPARKPSIQRELIRENLPDNSRKVNKVDPTTPAIWKRYRRRMGR